MRDRSGRLSRGECQAGRAWVGREHGGYAESMALHPWPAVAPEDQWAIDEMEERLADMGRDPDQRRARARVLRARAARTDIKGYREAWLALADRYEDAASRIIEARS
jgi:hypothetical protein